MPRRSSARSHSITSQESYAAVMIADVVADVPVDTVMEEDEQPQTKEATNLAYDTHLDGEVPSPTPNDASQKSNGAGISKGVILNAVQFGQTESKTKGDEKGIPMTTSLQVPEIKQPEKQPNGFKDMSLGRKVAFGFSFLPSIFFVLCFSVILPCNPKPCIFEAWRVELNNTEFTTGLEAPDNIVFTASRQTNHALIQLDKRSGIIKERELLDKSIYLKCGKITDKNILDCLVMDKSGKLYLFDSSLDERPMNITIGDEKPSLPAILPNCNGDMEDVAIAVQNSTIRLSNGRDVSEFSCDTVPMRMKAWEINGSSNIVFICQKDEKDILVSIPKNVWCGLKNLTNEKTVIYTGVLGSLEESVFEPTKHGIVLWSGSEVSMVQPDGSVSWKIPNLPHHNKNRFVLLGKFTDDGEQLAIISSNLSSGLEVMLLNPVDGTSVKNFSHSYVEATEVISVAGKKRDFAVLLLKRKAQDSVSTALNQIKGISTVIVNMISNEDGAVDFEEPFSEELALLDFHGNIDTVKTLKESVKDGAYKSAMTAIHDEKTGILSIYFVNTVDYSSKNLTEVGNIEVANWDKSTKTKCNL